MKERLVSRLHGTYKAAFYLGRNTSGVTPLGKKVLVQADEFQSEFAGGKLTHIPELVERMDLASESGCIIECGDQAFSRNNDGSVWNGRKPQAGDHVYTEKYAGLMVMGNDGKKYRLMDDSCVGAIYLVDGPGDDDLKTESLNNG